MIRKAVAYLLAVITTYALATVAATQSVLASLKGMGVTVSFGQRLEAIGHDLLGMANLFLPLIAVALLIAFVVTAVIGRWVPRWRPALHVAAGAVAVVALHLILNAVFDITPIAAARTASGLLVQALAGAVGGYAFVRASG